MKGVGADNATFLSDARMSFFDGSYRPTSGAKLGTGVESSVKQNKERV